MSTKIIIPVFSTVKEGTDNMKTEVIPVHFGCKDKIYTPGGKLITVSDEYEFVESLVMSAGPYTIEEQSECAGQVFIKDGFLKYNTLSVLEISKEN